MHHQRNDGKLVRYLRTPCLHEWPKGILDAKAVDAEDAVGEYDSKSSKGGQGGRAHNADLLLASGR